MDKGIKLQKELAMGSKSAVAEARSGSQGRKAQNLKTGGKVKSSKPCGCGKGKK
jgi:hypothetical protein